MCKLVDKQKIIMAHCNGQSNRKIAKELQLNRKTVNKYVAEYEEARKAELEAMASTTDTGMITTTDRASVLRL